MAKIDEEFQKTLEEYNRRYGTKAKLILGLTAEENAWMHSMRPLKEKGTKEESEGKSEQS